MPRRLNLPDNASVAEPGEGGKLFAPSAARNVGPIADLVARFAPDGGQALEIASGTGQHVVELARACPGLTWHPTEIDPARRQSVDAHVSESGLHNIRPATALDATAPGWSGTRDACDLIFLSNLLQLVSMDEARTLVVEAIGTLAPTGTLIIYGPFRRDGALTSDGDHRFDASLRAQDPEIGYKSDSDVIKWGTTAGADHIAAVEMPANNLALIWKRPAL
ncbi:DUF938 domain-containing protein [Shimia biformata]|uniref:DUF938 domain-containing protein n=1 Tax=Shimia biformata TaxID=1294299 RepID=UPI00195147BB|nr:DUF938 domain-containing protein [Shimia biformata]